MIGGGVKTQGIANLAGVYLSTGATGTPGAGANDVIAGNYIGTNPAGTAALGNGVGIRDAGAISLTVGGTVPGARNVIRGNTINGVEADAAGPLGGVIAGNLIGTNGAAGQRPVRLPERQRRDD